MWCRFGLPWHEMHSPFILSIQPDLLTSDELVATYKGVALMTSKGPVTVKTLANSPIK